MTVRKEYYSARPCSQTGCIAAPAWRLVDTNGAEIGVYCHWHVDLKIDALERYQRTLSSASREDESHG